MPIIGFTKKKKKIPKKMKKNCFSSTTISLLYRFSRVKDGASVSSILKCFFININP